MQAAVWGLGRVVALEHPDRWGGLIDLPEVVDARVLGRLAGVLCGNEDQVAVRGSGVFVSRLVHAPTAEASSGTEWKPAGTVLVTGGTGALGGQVARWLAVAGAEHLLLTSRRGPDAPGAAELKAELERIGVQVTVAACDVGDREALAGLLAKVPAESPLTAVVHAAGILNDGVLDGLTVDGLGDVLRSKMDAAVNLDELTRGLDLSAFVLFSSFAGTIGSVGQGNYAAANAVLDALAESRRGQGLRATSLAWGSWAETGLAAANEAVAARLRRSGVVPLPPEMAIMAMLQAVDSGDPVQAIVDLDWERFAAGFSVSRRRPLFDDVPEVQRLLRSVEASELAVMPSLAERLAGLGSSERNAAVLDLVRSSAAAVLGLAGVEAIDAEQAFKDLGFDSLTAIEFRNALGAVTGLSLPTTLVFDYPTSISLTDFLLTEIDGDGQATALPLLSELDRIAASVSGISLDEDMRGAVRARLQVMLSTLSEEGPQTTESKVGRDLGSATDEEMFHLIENELGL
jgi:NAD(P)-dependent dehydrogenase (short-subunit alcohol dehydrogenase family)/acyl carrier protein